AIRADDPDKCVPGRVWTTEVVVGLTNDKPCNFSTRLLVSTLEDELEIEPHTPGFMQQVAEKCALSRGRRFATQPFNSNSSSWKRRGRATPRNLKQLTHELKHWRSISELQKRRRAFSSMSASSPKRERRPQSPSSMRHPSVSNSSSIKSNSAVKFRTPAFNCQRLGRTLTTGATRI